MEWLETMRKEFIEFLRNKYKTPEELAKIWGGKPADYGTDFTKIRYPSKAAFNDAKGQKKTDISEFAKQAELKGYELEDGEEN